MMTPRDYITEQLSIILGTPVQPTPAQVHSFWKALTREEEGGAEKDAHGNFPAAASCYLREGTLEAPPLHQEIMALQHQYPYAPARWPGGRRFAACLTHDVDRIVAYPWRERWRQYAALRSRTSVQQAARWLLGGAWYAVRDCCGKSDHATFDLWLAAERRYGFHSTFFVLPEYLAMPTFYDHYYHYADNVMLDRQRLMFAEAARRVQEAQWEIGLHGSYASAYDAQILHAEKARLEEMLGTPVVSTRQHFLRFATERTPHVQAAVGLHADSTLGYSTAIGCRAGMAFPYYWPHEDDLLEVPLIIQDVGLLRGCDTGAEQASALRRARALIDRIAEVGGVVTLSWHTFPEAPGARECYAALLETIAHLDGWGCSLAELSAWWHTRRTMVRGRLQEARQGKDRAGAR